MNNSVVVTNPVTNLFPVSLLFCLILGTLLHYTYQLSGYNKFVGYFSAVNESIWEHTKLAAFPLIFFSIFLIFINNGKVNNIFVALPIALLVAIITVPVVFYLYTSITKSSIFWVDIAIFILACFLSNIVYWYIIEMPTLPFAYQLAGLLVTVVIILCFAKWTYNPPNLKIFTQIGYNNTKSM